MTFGEKLKPKKKRISPKIETRDIHANNLAINCKETIRQASLENIIKPKTHIFKIENIMVNIVTSLLIRRR